MPKQYCTGNRHADQIIKLLDKCTAAGVRPDDVYDDWLQAVEAALDAAPAHVRALAEAGKLAEDTPEAQALFQRLAGRYRRGFLEQFAHAFVVLLDSVDRDSPEDVLGEIYMAYGFPSSWAGQFFTPMPVARIMAQMTMDRVEAEVHERLKAAIRKSPLAEAALIAGLAAQGEDAGRWFLNRVLPAALEYYEPINVCDPCCGSGVMFLAAAGCLPHWMTDFGLVRFYGQDIDMGCVRMARINCRLYGLNGSGARWALALSVLELKALPEPHRTAYAEAQAAHAAGDRERVQQIAAHVRGAQMPLF